MTLLSILQSVLPEKRDPVYGTYGTVNEGYNFAIDDLTDRLSKAEFLIDENKLSELILKNFGEMTIYNGIEISMSELIAAKLPSLLSVVEKNV